MRIITISREFGSGGRELGKRIADLLKCDYYDTEIISAVAEKCKMDVNYVENVLDNHGWKNHTITFHGTLSSPFYIQSSKISLFIEQKKVIEEIAALGKDFVIVGRNADTILEKYHPFNIFVCAKKEAKVKRCLERASENEKLSEKQLLQKMKKIDLMRSQTREILTDSTWGKRDNYHLTVNTTDWKIKNLAVGVVFMIERWFEENDETKHSII